MRIEFQFKLYVDGVFFGTVWLTPSDLQDLTPIGRAVSGLQRYRSNKNQSAVYVETKG